MGIRRTHDEFVQIMHDKFPSIEILSTYETRESFIDYRCHICDHTGTVAAKRMLAWTGCPVCNHVSRKQSWSHDDFVKLVNKCCGDDYIVLGRYKNNHTPVAMRHLKCGGIFDKNLSSGLSERMCPYCSNKQVLVGFNDLWTTNPRKAMMLKDDILGCTMTGSEEIKVEVICPHCGSELIKTMKKFDENYCPCPYCSSTFPFTERYVMTVLRQLGIEFKHDVATAWSQGKRYDFIIGDSIIIEAHGQQHYTDKAQFHNQVNTSDVKENDRFKRELAKQNGILHYIELDCRRSENHYIRNSILNSELSELFDFNNFDWHLCDSSCFSLNDMQIVELYQQGLSAPAIATKLGISHHTAWRVLKKASKENLCDYDPITAREATQFKKKAS